MKQRRKVSAPKGTPTEPQTIELAGGYQGIKYPPTPEDPEGRTVLVQGGYSALKSRLAARLADDAAAHQELAAAKAAAVAAKRAAQAADPAVPPEKTCI